MGFYSVPKRKVFPDPVLYQRSKAVLATKTITPIARSTERPLTEAPRERYFYRLF